jgi:hypothetical protein
VNVLYGSSTGLTSTGDQFFHQNSPGVNDTAEEGDFFGWSLAGANFGKSSQADLAIGAFQEDVGAVMDAGAVTLLYGSSTGLTATGDQFFHQDSSGVNDTAETGDQFGSSLAGANFGKSSQADLAVGVFREDVGTVMDAGAVNVLYGSSTGLTVGHGLPPSPGGGRGHPRRQEFLVAGFLELSVGDRFLHSGPVAFKTAASSGAKAASRTAGSRPGPPAHARAKASRRARKMVAARSITASMYSDADDPSSPPSAESCRT